MLFLHPVFQGLAILLMSYVFYLGIQRFRSKHLHQRAVFQWKRHVLLGEIVLIGLFMGMIGGTTMVYFYWHRIFITGMHALVGLILVPLIIIGFVTGLYLNRKKGKYKILPLFHGVNNLIILYLSFNQIISGLKIL